MTDNYYNDHLLAGNEYEDYVCTQLRKRYGIIIQIHSSKKYQNDIGESAGGFEIKFDDKVATTNNLWIEVREKSNPQIESYTPSGIMRSDNTWLYLIGNRETLWVFSKRQLRLLYQNKKSWDRLGIREIENNRKTSYGMLIPVKSAERWLCLNKFVLSEGKDDREQGKAC